MLAELIPALAGMDQKQWTYKPRPSQAGPSRCLRAMVYHALKIPPKPLPGRAALIFDDSSWHEILTSDWLKKSAFKIHSEQMGLNCMELKSPFLAKGYDKCKYCGSKVPPYWIHGHIDWITTDQQGIDHLTEHKAVSHYSFEVYETGETIPMDYICQTVLYDNALKYIVMKENLGFAILLVKNKNTSRYMEYHLSYDDQEDLVQIEVNRVTYNEEGFPLLEFVRQDFIEHVIKNIRLKFTMVDEYVAKNTLPKREYDIDSWQCDYCRWNNYCLEEYKKEMKERKDLVELDDKTIRAIVELKTIISPERLRLKKLEDEIKANVKIEMFNKNGKAAMADKWLAELIPAVSTHLDKKTIPEDILKKATKITDYEKLNFKTVIKELKKKKVKPKVIGTSYKPTEEEKQAEAKMIGKEEKKDAKKKK